MATLRNTSITLGYASVPVALRSAKSDREVKLDRAVEVNGEWQKVKRIDVTEGNDLFHPCERHEIVYGKWDGETFIPIDPGKLAQIDEAVKMDDMVVTDFIPLKDVPFERARGSYFLTPQTTNPGAARSLKVIHDAMRKRKVAAVVKLSPSSKQYVGVLYAKRDSLLVTTLAYAEQVEEFDAGVGALDGIVADKTGVEQATLLIDAMLTEADVLDGMRDERSDARAVLVEQALAGEALAIPAKGEPVAPTVNGGLVDALQKSIEQAAKDKASPGRRRARKEAVSA